MCRYALGYGSSCINCLGFDAVSFVQVRPCRIASLLHGPTVGGIEAYPGHEHAPRPSRVVDRFMRINSSGTNHAWSGRCRWDLAVWVDA